MNLEAAGLPAIKLRATCEWLLDADLENGTACTAIFGEARVWGCEPNAGEKAGQSRTMPRCEGIAVASAQPICSGAGREKGPVMHLSTPYALHVPVVKMDHERIPVGLIANIPMPSNPRFR